ncbi:MAG: hypothetical protein GDA38_23320 [Hormoscilla sp. SP12CHS1]|nr:hypothetical protein [Hormoscilla sp. SP12CHS1]
MVLFFDDGKTFATGACPYEYIRATEGDTNRIFLAVEVAGYPIEAIVDTGAPYVILAPRVPRAIGFQPADALERLTMLIRGMRLDGSITRFNMTLVDWRERDGSIITESQLKHVKITMNTKELLQQVQYIVDAEGNQTAVQMGWICNFGKNYSLS